MIRHEHDGRTWDLTPITRRQYLELAHRSFEDLRAALIRDLDDAGASPELRLEKLREFDRDRGRATSLVEWALSLEGSCEIVALALEAAGKPAEDIDAMGDPRALTPLALRLIGIDIQTRLFESGATNEDADEIYGESEPDPTEGEAALATG